MKRLAVTFAALAAVSSVTAAVRPVRVHVSATQRTDCPAPWCAQVPTLYRLAAPTDPGAYLGDRISYESPSDWRHYAPLRDTVAGLVAGRTSTLDKVTALADWLKHAKVAAPHEYDAWPPSIIDLWSFPEAQCEEASFLLTAMLREAGIPAMRFTTWNNGHAAVRAQVDGRWIVVDATPTTPDNSGPAHVYAPGDPAVIPAFQERPLLTLDNVDLPGSDERIDSLTLFVDEPIDALDRLAAIGLDYGRVAFPVTNHFLYVDRTTGQLLDSGRPDQRVTVTSHLDAVDGGCLDQRGSRYSDPIRFVSPGLTLRTEDATVGSQVLEIYPIGYIESSLPACGLWRITYSVSDTDLDGPDGALATAEFSLTDASQTVVIRPEMLQIAPGADPEAFRRVVAMLAALPSYEDLAAVGGR